MKIITDNNVEIEIKIEQTNEPDLSVGWPPRFLQGTVYIDGKKYYRSSEIDATGCSFAMANGTKKVNIECIDWVLNNALYYGHTGCGPQLTPIE